MLRKFCAHLRELKPTVIVTYNGDTFDWPYIDDRCTVLGIELAKEIGFARSQSDNGAPAPHPHLPPPPPANALPCPAHPHPPAPAPTRPPFPSPTRTTRYGAPRRRALRIDGPAANAP